MITHSSYASVTTLPQLPHVVIYCNLIRDWIKSTPEKYYFPPNKEPNQKYNLDKYF